MGNRVGRGEKIDYYYTSTEWEGSREKEWWEVIKDLLLQLILLLFYYYLFLLRLSTTVDLRLHLGGGA